MNENLEKLKDEIIKSQKENQGLSDTNKHKDDEIKSLSDQNAALAEKITLSEQIMNELKTNLHSEKNFNIKIADNLAHQTQEATKLKQSESDHASEIANLNSQLEKLDQTIQSKNNKLAELQNERMNDLKTVKDLKEDLNKLQNDNQNLTQKLNDSEQHNSQLNK